MSSHDKNANDRQSTRIQYHFLFGLLIGVSLHIAFGVIWSGIAWILALNVSFFSKNYNALYLLFPLILIAVTQVIYLLPAYIMAVNRAQPELAKGIAICAILTALLSSGCFGLTAGLTGLYMLGISIVLAVISGTIAHWFTRRSR